MKLSIIASSTLGIVTLFALTGCSKHKEPAPPSESKPNPAATVQKPPPPPGVNVFNSFDAQNKYDGSVAWAVMNDGQSGYRGQAEWFVPTSSGALNVVDLAMIGKGSINVTVAEDKNGLPGKALECFLNVISSHFGKDGHLVLVSEAHPVLNAGAKYWLCAEPADSDTGCSWCYNNQNLAKGFAMEHGQGGWAFFQDGPRNGAFCINIAP